MSTATPYTDDSFCAASAFVNEVMMSTDESGGAASAFATNAFTCMTCRVAFYDADVQRAHYKTDWHRYNLKRKVAEMPPVTADNFAQRVLQQRAQAQQAEEKTVTVYCAACNKQFSNTAQHDNHTRSRKHKELEARAQARDKNKVSELNEKNLTVSAQTNPRAVKDATNAALKERLEVIAGPAISGVVGCPSDTEAIACPSGSGAIAVPSGSGAIAGPSGSGAIAGPSGSGAIAGPSGSGAIAGPSVSGTSGKTGKKAATPSAEEEEAMDTDSESVEEWDGEALGLEECFFCSHVSDSMEASLEHMSRTHSFFIPDLQYVADLEGLVAYLGAKVGDGHMCLWCNERTRSFHTTQAVQRHMRDKGHCRLLFEGDAVYEYSDYFDYRSSYPDFDPAAGGESRDSDCEVEENVLDDSGFQLVLPSGATIGHRTLQRYYRQNLRPNRQTSSAVAKALAQYRGLGWTGNTSVDARQRARDLQYMQRMKHRHFMRLGVKANKFQPHLRPQVVF